MLQWTVQCGLRSQVCLNMGNPKSLGLSWSIIIYPFKINIKALPHFRRCQKKLFVAEIARYCHCILIISHRNHDPNWYPHHIPIKSYPIIVSPFYIIKKWVSLHSNSSASKLSVELLSPPRTPQALQRLQRCSRRNETTKPKQMHRNILDHWRNQWKNRLDP